MGSDQTSVSGSQSTDKAAQLAAEREKLLASAISELAGSVASHPGELQTDEDRLHFGLKILGGALSILDCVLPSANAVANAQAAQDSDLVALFTILTGLAHDAAKAALERMGEAYDGCSSAAVDVFIEKGIKSVSMRGYSLSLANDPYPKPKFEDLLPPGVDPTSPIHQKTYRLSIEQAKEAGRLRMIEAFRKSPELSWLIKETIAHQSLRSALVGDEAPKDEKGRPIIPEDILAVVEVKPRPTVRMRKAT